MIANNFDELEKYALRTSKIGTKEQLIRLRHGSNSMSTDSYEKDGSSSQKLKHYDDIMRKEIRAHDSVYRNDPRARRYLGSKGSQEAAAQRDKEAMGRINFWDGAKPEGWGAGVGRNMWSDFGGGGGGDSEEEMAEGDDPNQQTRPDRRPDQEQGSDSPEGDAPDGEQGESSGPGQEPGSPEAKNPTDTGVSEPETPTTSGGPGLSGSETGGSTAAKTGEGAADVAGGASKAAGLASEAAPLASAAAPVSAAGSVAPAVTGLAAAAPVGEVAAAGAVAATANPLGIALIIGGIAIFLLALTLFFFWNPEEAKGDETTGTVQTVICIDPGHISKNASGDMATGASAPDGTMERTLNLQLANELKTELVKRGYRVVKTKTEVDAYVSNEDRVKICADAGAAIDYRIHFDAKVGVGTPGPWHEVPGPSYTNIHDTSLSYAKTIQTAIVKELGISGHTSGAQPVDGGVKNDTKALIGSVEANRLKIPAVLLETMTMDNANVAWIKNSANRAKLITGIANGIEGAIPPTQGNSSGNAIIDAARKYLGTKYVWGGGNYDGPTNGGFDCSGLTMYAVYQGTNKKVKLPHSSLSQSQGGTKIEKKDLQPGDLVFFGSPVHHVGIATGNGMFINAPNTGSFVREEKIWSTFVWGVRYE